MYKHSQVSCEDLKVPIEEFSCSNDTLVVKYRVFFLIAQVSFLNNFSLSWSIKMRLHSLVEKCLPFFLKKSFWKFIHPKLSYGRFSASEISHTFLNVRICERTHLKKKFTSCRLMWVGENGARCKSFLRAANAYVQKCMWNFARRKSSITQLWVNEFSKAFF